MKSKVIFKIFPLLVAVCALCGCSESGHVENVRIYFEQRDFRGSWSEPDFLEEIKVKSEIVYEYNHFLTDNEISNFWRKIAIRQPDYEEGTGYFSYTYFFTQKDNNNEDTRIKEMYLKSDITLYFGVY